MFGFRTLTVFVSNTKIKTILRPTWEQIFDLNVAHFKQVLDGVVPHDVLGVEEVGDGGIRDAQLPVGLGQPPLSPGEKNFTLSSETNKNVFVQHFFAPLHFFFFMGCPMTSFLPSTAYCLLPEPGLIW